MRALWKAAGAGLVVEIAVFAYLEETIRIGAMTPVFGCAAMIVAAALVALPIGGYLGASPKHLALLALLLIVAAPVIFLLAVLVAVGLRA